MSSKSNEHQPWLGKAESILSTIDELLAAINARENRYEISEKYRGFKEQVRDQAKIASKKDRSKLPAAERDYSKMIQEVAAFLKAPVNCDPFAGKLRNDLAYVRVNVSHFVCGFKHE